MFISRKKNRGFTLIELILYIFISSALLLLIGTTVVDAFFIKVKTDAFNDIAYNSRIVIGQLDYIIKDAQNISYPAVGSGADYLIFSTGSQNVTIDNYNGRIRVQRGAGQPYYLTDEKVVVKNVQFYNISPAMGGSSFKLSFTVDAGSKSFLREYSYSENFFVTLNSKIR